MKRALAAGAKRFAVLLFLLSFIAITAIGCESGTGDSEPPSNGSSASSTGTLSGSGSGDSGQTDTVDTSDWPADISLGGGPSATSTHYLLMSYLSDKLRVDYGVRGTVITGGSEEDIRAVENGEQEVSYTVGPSPLWAVNGEESFAGEPHKNIRLLCMTGDLYWMFCTTDKNIHSIADLAGKKFSGNYAGASYSYIAIQELLAYNGLTENDLSVGTYSRAPEAFDNLSSGAADACMALGPLNFSNATEFFSTYSNARLFPLKDSEIKAVTDKYNWATKGIIPGGMYANQNEDVAALKTQMLIMVPEDLPDSLVYQLLSYLYSPGNRADFEAIHPVYSTEFTLDRAVENPITPYHEAAVQFYKDLGVWTDDLDKWQTNFLSKLGWEK